MALVPALYRKYRTRVKRGCERVAPGITSRFEVFSDESYEEMKVSLKSAISEVPCSLSQEHTCWIDFFKQ